MSVLERAMPWLTLFLLLLLTLEPANAQLAGGSMGGSGAAMQVLQWVMSNIAAFIIAVGVVFVGVMLVTGHASLGIVGAMIVGGVVISQWQTIAALFPV